MRKKAIVMSMSMILLICCAFLVYKSRLENCFSHRSNTKADISQDIKFVDSETADIMKITNNDTDKDEVITRKASKWDIEQHTDINELTIKDIQKKYDIECLRNVDGYYYSIHKCDTGHYAYIMYKLDINRKTLVVSDFEFLSLVIHKSDFKSIKAFESTFDDVRKIDPLTDQLRLSTKTSGYSTLADGGVFYFRYGSKFVSSIKYMPPVPHNALTVILKKDFPALTTNAGKSKELKVFLVAAISVLLIGVIGFGIFKLRKKLPFKKKLTGRRAITCLVIFLLVLSCTYLGYEVKHANTTENNLKAMAAKGMESINMGTEKIVKLADNISDKDDVITKKVESSKVRNAKIGKDTIEDIQYSFGLECLRKTEFYYYSVHKCTDGSYAYIKYRFAPKELTLVVSDVEILNSKLSKKDFGAIKAGKSTLNDVKKVDPTPIIQTIDSGKISISTLPDGGKYVMVYGEDGDNSKVSEIKYIPPAPNSVLSIIYKNDFPR